ncbi:MAG TPA: DUF5676 family membrane protein [archaeon]|nr:DUF5676 family membrane protein [archaeon]
MKNATVFGLKFGALLGGLSAICGILLYVSPGPSMKIAEYLTHSTIQFTIKPFEPAGFVIGVALWAIIGTALGYIAAKMCAD